MYPTTLLLNMHRFPKVEGNSLESLFSFSHGQRGNLQTTFKGVVCTSSLNTPCHTNLLQEIAKKTHPSGVKCPLQEVWCRKAPSNEEANGNQKKAPPHPTKAKVDKQTNKCTARMLASQGHLHHDSLIPLTSTGQTQHCFAHSTALHTAWHVLHGALHTHTKQQSKVAVFPFSCLAYLSTGPSHLHCQARIFMASFQMASWLNFKCRPSWLSCHFIQ